MKKGCIIAISIVLFLFFGIIFLFREAFGPKHRKFELLLENNRTLICNETYSADLAGIFFDVDFTLRDGKDDLMHLGEFTFFKDNWNDNIQLIETGGWVLLGVENGNHAKILMHQREGHLRRDTTFSPSGLNNDSLWRLKYEAFPQWLHRGQVKIDSIIKNRIYLSYEYRTGHTPPFQHYTQSVEYELNTISGEFKTTHITERTEIFPEPPPAR